MAVSLTAHNHVVSPLSVDVVVDSDETGIYERMRTLGSDDSGSGGGFNFGIIRKWIHS